jgi:hypothetical protein
MIESKGCSFFLRYCLIVQVLQAFSMVHGYTITIGVVQRYSIAGGVTRITGQRYEKTP